MFSTILQNIDRLEFISIKDPLWSIKISEFLEKFPEFNKYRGIAPLTKRPFEDIRLSEDWMPKTLFEDIIYYACIAGVRYTYAVDQFKKIVVFLRSDTWVNINANLYNFLMNSTISQKKKEIYWSIFVWMGNRGITNNTLTIENALAMKSDIKGLGDSYYGYIKCKYTEDDDCIQITDRGFIKGFEKVYGKKNKAFIENKINEYLLMGFGRVANGFMFQIFHYS